MHESVPDRAPRNPFVFVVGCPRSGTTLLQRMLDHHPALAVANDSHFIPRGLEKFAPQHLPEALSGDAVPLSDALVDGVIGYHRFSRLGIDERTARNAARDTVDYAGFVSALYAAFAASRGKPLGGEKTPDYVRRLPLLGGLFPGARFVHIIRDGRDVALSVMQWANEKKGPGKLQLWSDSRPATCALWWAWQVGSGRRDGGLLGKQRYLEVRYEGLVENPERELRRIVEFLGLPYSGAMLRYHEGKTRARVGASAKSNWLPPTRGLRDWREQLGAADLEVFEALAGDLLDELGMQRGVSRITPQAAAKAALFEQRWSTRLREREAKAQRRIRRARARGSAA